MGHCGGGDGADAFGAEGQRSRGMPPLVPGAEHDSEYRQHAILRNDRLIRGVVLAAMVEWVENGVAPDHLVAARYTNNDVTQGLDFTRKLCPVSTRLAVSLRSAYPSCTAVPAKGRVPGWRSKLVGFVRVHVVCLRLGCQR
jgi:hypothetical protein